MLKRVRQFYITVPATFTNSFIYYLSMGGARGLAVAYLHIKTRLAKRLTVGRGEGGGERGRRGKKPKNGQICLANCTERTIQRKQSVSHTNPHIRLIKWRK